MIKPEKPSAPAVTFHAPGTLVARLDVVAEHEMTSRSALLRRIAARAMENESAA